MEITNIVEAVAFAQKIARKMSQDPEVDSIAGEAAWRAMYTWDRSRNVALSWWIAQLTKQSVIHYWRRLARLRAKEKLQDELWWQKQEAQTPQESELAVPAPDWQLLVESYILKWPLDVIARERGISITTASAMRKAALSRLEAAC